MIKEKDLNQDMETVKTSLRVPMSEMKNRIETLCRENQIPVTVAQDTLKTGGLFNSKEFGVLVVGHPEHLKDYFRFVIIPGYGEMSIASCGISKQIKKKVIAESNKQWRKGRSMSEKVGNIIGSAVWLIGKSKNKLELEQNYYDQLLQAIGIALEAEG